MPDRTRTATTARGHVAGDRAVTPRRAVTPGRAVTVRRVVAARLATAVGAIALGVTVVVVAVFGVRSGFRGSGAGPTGGPSAAGTATVVRVVDGDTVVVAIDGAPEPVRLIGIDTPEIVAPDRPDECFGAEASARLAEILPPDTEVRLTRDVEPRDIYDRLLGYVERASDGLFVNLAQVAGGYAVASDYPPNVAHRDELERAERAARDAGLGLWSACGGADVPVSAPSEPAARGP